MEGDFSLVGVGRTAGAGRRPVAHKTDIAPTEGTISDRSLRIYCYNKSYDDTTQGDFCELFCTVRCYKYIPVQPGSW